jgi:hypothetical protein
MRTLIAGVAIGVSVLALPAAAAVGTPSHRLTPSGSSNFMEIVQPLAGSANTLVFSRQSALARDANYSASSEPPYLTGPVRLLARAKSGHVTSLGPMPSGATVYLGSWSVYGDLVAAGNFGHNTFPQATSIYVWSTVTGQRHTLTLRHHDVYLAAAPGGIAYATLHGVLKLRTLAGRTTTLATPFMPSTLIDFGTSGPDGIVVTAGSQIAYVPFAAPHKVVLLDHPTSDGVVACEDVSATYAACSDQDGDYLSLYPDDAMLVPLDGGSTTLPDLHGCAFDRAALDGNTLVWTCGSRAAVNLFGERAGSGKATKLTSTTSYALTSAYGSTVASSPDRGALVRVSAAGQVNRLVRGRESPISVDSFALKPSRVVYSDDQPVTSRGGRIESVFSRSLRTQNGQVAISAPTLLSSGRSKVTGNLVGASGSLRVYATITGPDVGAPHARLHVVSAAGTKTITGVLAQTDVQVSGHYVLYLNGSNAVEVYDAKSRKTMHVVSLDGLFYAAAALSGHYVAYATEHGAIYRRNLETAATRRLAAPLKNDVGGVEVSVYAAGDWVGWTAQPLLGELSKSLNRIRNAKTMAPAITLPHTLYSMSHAGVLLDSAKATYRAEDAQAGLITTAARFWLRRYGGRTTSLLSKRRFVAGPEIAGHLLGWAGANGVLRVVQLP